MTSNPLILAKEDNLDGCVISNLGSMLGVELNIL